MVATEYPLTLLLSIALGAYMTAAAAGDFLAPRTWRKIVADLRAHPALVFFTGIVAFTVGVAIVMVHNHWGDPLAVIITLIGWAAIIEGLVLLAAPQWLLDVAERVVAAGNERWAVVVALSAGLILLTVGLTGSVQG